MNLLKSFTAILACFAIALFFSCTKDDIPDPTNELEGLSLATSMSVSSHQIDFYTTDGTFKTGYNRVYIQIKNADKSLISNATAAWTPIMHMMHMKHSSPYSMISKRNDSSSTYEGYIIFQMAGNEMEHWELTLTYSVEGVTYTVTDKINVVESPKRIVESFQGNDGQRYVLALIDPVSPKVGTNEMSAMLYKMNNMMDFLPVENYQIKIDPRMPGMGNHGSPNNVHLTHMASGLYHGKLSLTMTGYWKVNLQLANDMGHIIKGEEITETNEGSSIYFEVEF